MDTSIHDFTIIKTRVQKTDKVHTAVLGLGEQRSTGQLTIFTDSSRDLRKLASELLKLADDLDDANEA